MMVDFLQAGRRRRRLGFVFRALVVSFAGTAAAMAVVWIDPGVFAQSLRWVGFEPYQPAPVATVPIVPARNPAPQVPLPPAQERAVFSEPRPLRQLLVELAERAGRGLVVEAAVDTEVVAAMNQDSVPWRRALAAYARVAGLVFRVDGDLIEVREARSGEPAGEEILEPQALVAAIPAIVAAPLPEPNDTRIYRFHHTDAASVAEAVQGTLRDSEVRVNVDAGANALVLHGPKQALAAVLAVVEELDRPRRRVLLEVKILEVSRSAREDLGAQWALGGEVGAQVSLGFAEAGGESGALVVATGGSSPLSLRLAALEAAGKVRIVSEPKVVVLEGSTAKIESVRILRIRLPDRGAIIGDEVSSAGASAGRATEEVPVGVSLEVAPSVRAGARVHMKIAAKSSYLGPPLPPDGIPEEISRTVEVEIEVAAGSTALLGGLRREGVGKSRSSVPVLGRIPFLGALFRKRSNERDLEELLILVTPTLMADLPAR